MQIRSFIVWLFAHIVIFFIKTLYEGSVRSLIYILKKRFICVLNDLLMSSEFSFFHLTSLHFGLIVKHVKSLLVWWSWAHFSRILINLWRKHSRSSSANIISRSRVIWAHTSSTSWPSKSTLSTSSSQPGATSLWPIAWYFRVQSFSI